MSGVGTTKGIAVNVWAGADNGISVIGNGLMGSDEKGIHEHKKIRQIIVCIRYTTLNILYINCMT